MVFPSIAFLFLFFPLFLLAYALLPYRNLVILVFSLVFYIWGEGTYVVLLLATVVLNYFVGQKINKAHCLTQYKKEKFWLFAGVAGNLGILFYYKYFGFVADTIMGMDLTAGGIPVLPLGISFFIFQSISYLVDVFRKQAKPADSMSNLALYITMFPQLVAGPIVRYSSISDAIRSRTINFLNIRDGLFLFVGGLSQKVIIANSAGEIADVAFNLPYEQVTPAVAWIGSMAYTLQIFFDFSGYSTMAIGIGLTMGFAFPPNFNYPYISQSITEFWQRWHISLSSWFRDYLYIPLGGNRKGRLRTYCNLFIVFLLCGLWHGAAWTFVVWGIYHGVLLILERLFIKDFLGRIPAVLCHAYTMLFVIIGWTLFRADNFQQAWIYIQALFGVGSGGFPAELIRVLNMENILYCSLGLLLATPVLPYLLRKLSVIPLTQAHLQYSYVKLLILSMFTLMLAILCVIYIYAGTYNPFIYFRF